jgi:hypothetical protein
MQFLAQCTASVSVNGASIVLLRFEPLNSHLTGRIAKEFGELERGETYEVIIRKIIKGE